MSASKLIQTGGDESLNFQSGGDIIIQFDLQKPLTKKQVETELLHLDDNDLIEITSEAIDSRCDDDIAVYSYVKNYWLQLKAQMINSDFSEKWLPELDCKAKRWHVTPVYMGIVFPFSYDFVEVIKDNALYFVPFPLPFKHNRTSNGEIDMNNPVDKVFATEIQYKLGRALTPGVYRSGYNTILDRCKMTIGKNPSENGVTDTRMRCLL